jgi:uncharacterized protein (DUF2252 family)
MKAANDSRTVDPYKSHASERAALGKAARSRAPRSAHAEWQGRGGRDPVELLAAQDETRVPELVPIRYGRMLRSPFAFFRGAAVVMAADLADTPTTGLHVQLCGDAHLANFGVFSAPDRRLVFDCNDFDETAPGPFEWDVKRLAASVAVAGRDRGHRRRERRRAILGGVAAYRTAMRRFAAMRDLDVWYARTDVESRLAELGGHVASEHLQRIERNVAKARSKDSLRALRKLARPTEDGLRIAGDPPLITPVEDLADGAEAESQVEVVLAEYRSSLSTAHRHIAAAYRYVHAARKVVGVGSVGTRAWIVLLVGRDSEDPLFLQAKEAQASVLEPHVGRSRFESHGRRVVEGQRLMQAASDIFLGWVTVKGTDGLARDFYVRQLWDGKGSADLDRMSARELGDYVSLCGEALARAHARSGDGIAIAAYLGTGSRFDEAIADFAEEYAGQTEHDFESLEQAADEGRIAIARDL